MYDDQTTNVEELYERGMAQFHAADWPGAIETFTKLRSLTNAHPEIESLISDAQLKLELDRAETLEAVAPPKNRTFLRPRFITAVPVLFVLGIILVVLRPPSAPMGDVATAPTSAITLPTPAPTNTPAPTETPFPTNTPAPTNTPLPTSTPLPGLVTVRMAEDQTGGQVLGNLEIILDASGSMGGLIGDQKKIDIAHEALGALVNELPDTANVALRAYGHRLSGDCSDTELVTPLGPLDRAGLAEKINAIRPAPNGMTPIAASLQQLAEDMKDAQGDVQVVLVSDGDETCNGDPVQVATQIHAANPKIKIDVIGFNVGPEDWRARLSGISQGGGGRYFDAADATQLVGALKQSILVSYHIISADGRLVYQGVLGSSATLPPGTYTVEVAGVKPLTIKDVVVSDRPAVVELRQQDGNLTGGVVEPAAP